MNTSYTVKLEMFSVVFVSLLFILKSDVDPDLWIRMYIIKVGSGSVWRDTNPDSDQGHML